MYRKILLFRSLQACGTCNGQRIKAHFLSDKNVRIWPIQLRMLHQGLSAPSRMLAWQIHQYGGVEQLTLNKSARAVTIRSPTEILVKIHSSSVNPVDIRMMGGYGQSLINVLRKQKGVIKKGTEFPLILGRDFSGTVIETGKSVKKFKIGDEVWGAIGAARPGTHAEYTVTAESEISHKPRNISHVEAASIPFVALTTWAGLCTVGELSERKAQGKRLLILGGSGGVGTFCIQMMKAWGLHVTVTCSPDAADFTKDLGADVVVDYKNQNVWQALNREEKFDLILDTLGGNNTEKAFKLLRPWQNSKLISLASPVVRNSDNHGVVPGLVKSAVQAGMDTLKGITAGGSIRWAAFNPNSRALEQVKKMVENSKIRPVVQEVIPFTDVPAAYQKIIDGHLRGKIVISTENILSP